MNLIPIARQPGPKSLTSCLAICRQFLEETGGILILYPEGTRSRDGRMGNFKSGAGLFATELGVPLVPAHVEGTHHVLPKGRSIPHPGRVKVRFGEVLSLPSFSSSPGLLRDQRRSVVEQLERSVRSLGGLSEPEELVAPMQEKG
jgi:1-acyl-sn-glycerol-3-phosphate acyltransferase